MTETDATFDFSHTFLYIPSGVLNLNLDFFRACRRAVEVPALSISCWLMLKTTNFLAVFTVSVFGGNSSSGEVSESAASSDST